MKILLDFDGTIVEHAYPKIGRCNFGCVEIIRKLQDAGHRIILNTYRADLADGTLEHAIEYINNYLYLDVLPGNEYNESCYNRSILEFTNQKIHPQPWDWALMNYNGEIHIDDIALGIPLKPTVSVKNGMMVNWDIIALEFGVNGII